MKHLIITTILCVLIASCAADTNNTQPAEEILIGGLFAQTGFGAEWGTTEQQAAELAIDEINAAGGINGVPLTLIIEDTQTDVPATVTAFNKLRNVNEIIYFIGPTWEAGSQAIAPLAEEVIILNPSSYDAAKKTPTMFGIYPPYELEVSTLIPFYDAQGWNSFAVIYNQEYFSELSKNLFIQVAEEANWNVKESYSLALENTDFRTMLLKIRELDVDAIYAPLGGTLAERSLLKRQMQELNINLPLIVPTMEESDELLEKYGSDANGTYFPAAVPTELLAPFNAKYTQKYGVPPSSPSAATAYDATKLLALALENTDGSIEEIRDYLLAVENYQGVSNTITFTPEGIISNKEHVMKQIQGSNSVTVS